MVKVRPGLCNEALFRRHRFSSPWSTSFIGSIAHSICLWYCFILRSFNFAVVKHRIHIIMLSPRTPSVGIPQKHSIWARPKLADLNGRSGHKVSSSGSSKSAKYVRERACSQPLSEPSISSRSSSPLTSPSASQRCNAVERLQTQNWQRVDRQSEALSQ